MVIHPLGINQNEHQEPFMTLLEEATGAILKINFY